jgi:hypothetical protein
MFKIKTNQIQTWSLKSPIRHCLILKREIENTIPEDAEIINEDLLKGNYNIKLKR